MGFCNNIGVAQGAELSNNCRANKSSMACDIDLRILFQFEIPLDLCVVLQKGCYGIHDILNLFFSDILMDPYVQPIIPNIFSLRKVAYLVI